MSVMKDLNDSLENMNLSIEEQKEIECHARIISFFAHKGGVSKTTTVHHLGYLLAAKFGYKVLMIDADSQQNLTHATCKQAKNDATWRDEVDRGTIYTAMERLHYGMKDGNYISPANCVKLQEEEISSLNNTGELWLLPGSLDLAKLEPQITFAHNITNPKIFPLFEDIAGGFRALFLSTCAYYNIDFCLIDMGPSIGELNKSLFWSSDYFIIPCSPDSYCNTTMKTMERTLPLWTEQQLKLAHSTKDQLMPLNPNPPQFLGIIFNLFEVTGKNKVPVKNNQYWMDIIKQTVKNELVPVLKKSNMLHVCSTNDYTLEEIPNFLSLMPISQKSHCPVYCIPDDGWYESNIEGEIVRMSNSVIDKHKERANYFYNKYLLLSNVLLNMFQKEDEQVEDNENVNTSNN